MNLKDKIVASQLEILSDTIIREERIARLYETFAKYFSDQAEFWMSLARVEHVHATMLRQMKNHIEQHGEFVWNLGRLKHGRFSEEERLLEVAERDLSEGRIDFPQALKVAAEIGKSVFHSEFYDVMNCELPFFKETAEGLRRVEKRNYGQLEKSMTAIA